MTVDRPSRELTTAEIIRALRIVHYSSQTERNARRAPSINGIANAAGLSRDHINKIASGIRTPGPHATSVLSRVLKDL